MIADVFLPGRNGFELCRHVKSLHRHVRVILTAGLLEQFDEDEARRAGCDAILKKPFEASVVMQTIRPLIAEAQMARGLFAEAIAEANSGAEPRTRRRARACPAGPAAHRSRHHSGARRRAARR